MLNVTEAALDVLKSTLEESGESEHGCLRIAATPEGARLLIDQERADDVSVQHQGHALLVMDQDAADLYDHSTLDYDAANSRLIFR